MDFCPVCETRLVSGVCIQCKPVDFQELPYKSWLTWMKSQRAAYHIIGPFSCGTYYPKDQPSSHSLQFSQCILRAKDGSKEAANYLCEKMYDYLAPPNKTPNKTPSQFFNLDDVEIIVPVPNRRRVYVDATLIADEFAKIICEKTKRKIRSDKFILERVGKSNLNRRRSSDVEKYRASLQDYKVTEKMKEHKNFLKDKKIFLIDDNRTSGITIGVCSSLLLQLGAKRVIMFCAGRADGSSVPYLPSSTKIKRI